VHVRGAMSEGEQRRAAQFHGDEREKKECEKWMVVHMEVVMVVTVVAVILQHSLLMNTRVHDDNLQT
jgi:hypothetical protein